ncbi:Metallo-hydrolase/oxidoreductase [Macrolepiota fuliginosa MF-IS2]|uniref:Metallo-hydrolase/oxidoreductase n=1 Tax=Macrolepiota fuliginosa MF-IS2 TaxID=1400762 RepID=A0A9P6C8S2_9AGAR|nr:Metallo-hydrolase/oxidoreductase [Macrolepiota fuliginosa MF-IS2]
MFKLRPSSLPITTLHCTPKPAHKYPTHSYASIAHSSGKRNIIQRVICKPNHRHPDMAAEVTTATIGNINITFLGTASAQPSRTRNHSSLALRLGGDVWLFDCGEATQNQIQKSDVKMGRIKKIFITHTHGDHIFGLKPLLASCMNGAGGTTEGNEDPRTQIDTSQPPLEIYGPIGTRAFIRTALLYTHTNLNGTYIVHELRFPSDPQAGDFTAVSRLPFESEGRNIPQANGVWEDIYKDTVVSISAAPIQHSVSCVGYVVNEAPVSGKIDPKKYIQDIKRTNTPMSVMRQLQQGVSVKLSDGTILHGPPRRKGRKIVILGDTHDPSPIAPLAYDADLLIHEATNAHLPGIDPNTKETDTNESVEERAKSRGHSTPQMAGAFAKHTRAKKLVLNHFSSRYPGDDAEDTKKIMGAIGGLAAGEYGQDVICARDFMSFNVLHSHD